MADNWQKVREVFDAALRQEPEARQNYISEACGNDKDLLAEVESLLLSFDKVDDFMETPAVAQVADIIESDKKSPEAGTRFGHYEVIREIGSGGMGEVYLAKDQTLDRLVAIKILNEQSSWDETNLERFVREAKTASALNHPNIIVIHEIGESEDKHYIVSEFIEGRTLREALTQSQMTPDKVLDVSIQIAGALSAAHEAHLVHRDIKPENVMVRPDGYVKVLDFGLAKLIENKNKPFIGLEDAAARQNQTAKGAILGTVNYMSPEQAKGERIDERTDIFSLGVVIYEMIGGRTPFAADSMSETLANLITAEPQPLSSFAANVPGELQRIVFKMLRKKRDERYKTMKDALSDLRAAKQNLAFDENLERSHQRDGHPTAILQATTDDANKQTAETQDSFSQRIKRNRSFAALALVSLLISAVGLGFYSFFAGKTPSSRDAEKTIAVLPLKPINTENRDQLYEIGVADSLILKLSSMKGFIVRPLSATRKYADVEQDALAAGREQQVDFVLSSNYQLAGGTIRITAQLLNVANGQIEETYKSEKDAANVFAMQDAIAGEIGKLLQARFATTSSTQTAKRGTSNEEAYLLYLQGMYLLDKESSADSKRAIELFDTALSIDPDYAKAWAGKARAHCSFAHWGGSSPDAEFAKAEPALGQALALDNNLPEAYGVLGIIKADYNWNFAESERQFLRAIEIAPDSDNLYRWYANRLAGKGRSEEAISRIKTAIDLNPNSLSHQIVYGRILYFARRYDEAITQLHRVIEMDSARPVAYNLLWRSYHQKGDNSRAYQSFMSFQQLIQTNDEVLKNYETSYAKSGWEGVLLRYIEIVKANDAKGSAAYTIAVLSALSGQREQSLRYLNEALKNRSLEISNIKGDPGLDLLRDDPRFAELVRRVEIDVKPTA